MDSVKKQTGKKSLLLGVAALAVAGGAGLAFTRFSQASRGPGEAADVIARLQADEAQIRSAQLSLTVERRVKQLADAADVERVWREARQGAVQERRLEELALSGEDWRREVTVMDPFGSVQSRLVLGLRGGEGRVLQEQGFGADSARAATLGTKPDLEPLVGLLMQRSAPVWEGVKWSGVRRSGDRILLSGRGGETVLQVTLRTTPRYAVEKIERTTPIETKHGKLDQKEEMLVHYTDGETGPEPQKVEHLMYAGAPMNRALHTLLEVGKAEFNAPVSAEALAVRIPRGTHLTDERHDPALQYVAKERDLTEAEVRKLQAERRFVAKVDRPAPGWQVKTLDGKSARLEDYLGKVVVLTWFASW